MSKKRRVFDIDMPVDDAPASVVVPTPPVDQSAPPAPRRGPMATAITESAVSNRARSEIEAQIRAENDALAHEHVRLKGLGLVIQMVPLDAVECAKLVRDRAKGPDFELAELKESITAIGLSNPIRLEARGDGRFELIQGYRRLSAYRELLESTGDADAWGLIPAVVTDAGDSLDDLYRRMVDENMVRKDISFAEMAQLALDYAADPAVTETDADKAVAVLFKSAGYQKRSYIRSFIKLVAAFQGTLLFMPHIPRALGLALVAKLDEQDGVVRAVAAELADWDNRSIKDELDVLRRVTKVGDDADAVAPPKPAKVKSGAGPKAKTSFQLDRAEGRAKCTAADGRLEIRLDRDFSAVDRLRLEQAVRTMLDQLD